MSYRFVFGGTGSGKSEKVFNDCIEESLRHDGSHFLLVVPEQATTETEQEIVRRHPRHATAAIDVVSFNRLAYKVFEELGIRNPEVLDDISKAMIIRKLAAEQEDGLRVWKRRFDRPGFVDSFKSMLSELYQYGIKPERLKETDRTGLRPGLQNKLNDLIVMYDAFSSYIADRYITAEEIPDVLSRVIHNSSLIRDAVIILDGFTGFTPIQYRIIESFLCYAREVVVTVSISSDADPYKRGGAEELFAMAGTITAKITDLASANGVSHGQDTYLTAGSFMEKHILRYDGAESGETGTVCIAGALNVREEIRFAAADISRLVKEEGARFRDIAVINAAGDVYDDLMREEFDAAQIPYYLDRSIPLSENALVGMIDAALEVIRKDYSYEAFIRYLKTGLVSDNERMIYCIDSYMYVCGKRGWRRMSAEWDYLPEEMKEVSLEELNAFRRSVLDTLEGLRRVFGGEKPMLREVTGEIRRLLTCCRAEEKISAMAAEFEEAGDPEHAREYSAAAEAVTGLLDRMEELLGEERIHVQDFIGLFDSGAAQLKIGMIPSGSDKVIIGDMTRTRLEHIRYLYVTGANEGYIPKLLNRISVITDDEKETLKRTGLELSPGIREDLCNQRYYLYRILTKPERKLTVSYSCMDSAGKALRESYIIPHLKKLYPNAEVRDASSRDGIYYIAGALRAVSESLRKMRESGSCGAADADFAGLYAYLGGSLAHHKEIRDITDAALYSGGETGLGKEAADLLYGQELYSSVTRLERYEQCPFEYFMQYGLHLKEMQRFGIGAVDIGNLSHAALEKVFFKARRNGYELDGMTGPQLDALVTECIEEAVKDDPSAKYSDTSRNGYLVRRIERTVRRSLRAMTQQMGSDGFIPYEFEWKFSYSDGLKSMRLDLGNGKTMGLSGKIDRVDIRPGDTVDIRIIDYKTGAKKWSESEVLNGNDLQLSMYMNAVRELLEKRFPGRTAEPDSMYYYTIQDPLIDEEKIKPGESSDEAFLRSMKPSGTDDRAVIRALMDFAKEKAAASGREISEGRISISPKNRGRNTSCSWCPYRAVCGFDGKIPGFRYRTDERKKPDGQ